METGQNMMTTEPSKRRVASSGDSIKTAGNVKRTAAFFSESILKRYRHRFAAPKLRSLVYLLLVRRDPLRTNANRMGTLTFSQGLYQTHRHSGAIDQIKTLLAKGQSRTIRQFFNKTTTGDDHFSDQHPSKTRSQTVDKTKWTGLDRTPEVQALTKQYLTTGQFAMRQMFQPEDHLSTGYSNTVILFKAPTKILCSGLGHDFNQNKAFGDILNPVRIFLESEIVGSGLRVMVNIR